MEIAIHVEVDEGDPSADPDDKTGITNEAYERLTEMPGPLSWLGEIVHIQRTK